MANIFIKTFGCALNQSDSELMAGVLKEKGHKIVHDEKIADVVVINSCTVKNEAESKFYREIKKHKGKKMILAGCVIQAEKELVDKLKDYSIIGTSQISKIDMVVERTLSGNRAVLLDSEKKRRLNLPKIRKNDKIEIIPISEGCLGRCTYCKTKQARGELFSYDKKEIINQAKHALKEGVKEIWLTSQDTGAYGLDINETLPSLLNDILKINGDFKLRLGMCNPDFALRYADELASILLNKKMFRFIHLPVQSGSNSVLKAMGRRYTKEDFLKAAKKIKDEVFGITISTDIIVGFPSETEEDFEKTIELVKELKPDVLNISRFWKRPNTAAANMKQLDSKTIKQRSKRLKDLFEKIALDNNKKWIGWKGVAIIEEKGKNSTFTARNFAYKPIIIEDNKESIGDKVTVKITSCTSWDLRGKRYKK